MRKSFLLSLVSADMARNPGFLAVAALLALAPAQAVTPPAAASCGAAVSRAASGMPSWAASAQVPPTLPHLQSTNGSVLAVIFGYPLRAGHPSNPANKILWIVGEPRDGSPLEITATPVGATKPVVRLSRPADSSPGEIYPSIVDVPSPGCWHFVLAWNGHRDEMDLSYVARDGN